MTWKIGYHGAGVGNYDGFDEWRNQLATSSRRLVFQQTDASGELATLQRMGTDVDTVLIFRRTGGMEHLPYTGNPEQFARERMAAIADLWPVELNPTRVWTCSTNEPSKEYGDMEWLARYELECAKEALRMNRRYLAFGWSGGTPEPDWWENPWSLQLLQLCAANSTMLGIRLHEYSFSDDIRTGTPWLVGRFQFLHSICDTRGIARPTIVIGECGWQYNQIPLTPTQFADQIGWLQALYGPHPNILGAAIWTWGTWHGSAVQDVIRLVPTLIDTAVTYDEPEPPPPDPDPEPRHKAIVVKAPQEMTLTEWLAICEKSYEFRHTVTASHDDMATVLHGGNDRSFVKVAFPERPSQVEAIRLIESLGFDWELLPGFEDDPSPPQHLIPVEPFSQRDPMWAGATIGQPTGHGKTIGNWGCLYMAYYMMARHWGIESRGVLAAHAHWVSAGAFNNQYLKAGALKIAYPNVIDNGWLPRSNASMMPTIRNYLAQGIPVAARVDFDPSTPQWEQHWVLLIGEDAYDWIMIDPWHGDILPVASRYGIEGSDILEALFYMPPADPPPPPPPPPGVQIDVRHYMIADPDCWRVVKHIASDSHETNEDVQDMELGGGMYVRRKNSLAEWWYRNGSLFYLIHDTSPDPGGDGIPRLYTLYKNGDVGAPKNPVTMAVGSTWFENGQHLVQFRAKHGCHALSENSGYAQNKAVITRVETNFTFNSYGQNLKFDSVIWIQTGVETQVYARQDGRSCGWVGWAAPWGYSEPVEIHWNRGRMTQEPDRICSW